MLEKYRFDVGRFCLNFWEFTLTGSDTQDFLQKQSTFNISLMREMEFHLASFLDPQGRIDFYCWVCRGMNEYKVLVPYELKDKALIRLEKFLISEDVMINDKGAQEWTVMIGPAAFKSQSALHYSGIFFEEKALLTQEISHQDIQNLTEDEVENWRRLNGWPDLKGTNFKHEIINNTRLFELSVSAQKGCYPGQETVSKIAVNRGAAYAPVLIQTLKALDLGDLFILDKKVGEVEFTLPIDDYYISGAKILRDFRVSGLELSLEQSGKNYQAKVKYYPFYSGDPKEKSLENFYLGAECFKNNQLHLAESFLKNAIELDPGNADAFESLGVMLGRQERFSEAIDLMDKLAAVDPSSVLANTNKSLYLMRLGKIEEAEQEKSLATIKSFQKFGDEAKLKEKIEQEKIRQEAEWSKREQMFKQVLEIDLEDTLANYGMGSIEVERKNWASAQNYLEKVLSVDTQYSVAYLALGKAYKGLGLKDKAREIWQKGLEIAAKKGDLMPANQMQMELTQI
jgi:tetratricopeptide (TPR) repeat protein